MKQQYFKLPVEQIVQHKNYIDMYLLRIEANKF